MASQEEQQQNQNTPDDIQQEELAQENNDEDQVNQEIENIAEQQGTSSPHGSQEHDQSSEQQLNNEENDDQLSNNYADGQEIDENEEQVKKAKYQNEDNPQSEIENDQNKDTSQEIQKPYVSDENVIDSKNEDQPKQSNISQDQKPKLEQQPQLMSTPVKKGQQQQTQQFSIDQFLNGTLDHYRNPEKAFKSIDKKTKGYLDLEDFVAELHNRFNVSDEQTQREIFSKIGEGAEKIEFLRFLKAFVKIVEVRAAEKDRQLATMNIAIGGNAADTEKNHLESPFKNKNEREDIMKIFQSQQPVSLEDANKQEHFQPDSKYAPLIRKLRQQNNFDDFVRSYNSLNLVNPQQQQQNKSQQQQILQQQPYAPFASLLSQTKDSNLFQSQQNYLNTSPSRPTQDKFLTLTFSPLKNSFEPQQNDHFKDLFSSSDKAYPQKHSYLDVFSQKQDRTSQASSEFFKNQTSADKSQNIQDLFSSQKQSLNNMNTIDRGFAKLAQSTYIPANEDPQSPNQRRLDRLKKKVNVGIESLQNIHKTQEFASPNFKSRVTGGKGNVRDQFKQFMGQTGQEGQVKSSGLKSSEDTNKFDEILNRFSGKGGDKKENISLDARRQNGTRTEGFGQSQVYHGIHGQMKRVEQIQTSLRTLPKKTSTSKPSTKLSTESGLSGLSDWKFSPKFDGASSSSSTKVFQSQKGQTTFFSKRNSQK